jgi:polyhydroxyalkanoate synthesis regulator phasin
MTADEIKEVVRDVLNEQKLATQPDLDKVVLKTIATLLTSFGIEEDDRMELKADFSHLRRWRKSVEQAQSYTFKIVITTIVTGFLGAVWLGFQAMLHK